jgi:hypothetical protein
VEKQKKQDEKERRAAENRAAIQARVEAWVEAQAAAAANRQAAAPLVTTGARSPCGVTAPRFAPRPLNQFNMLAETLGVSIGTARAAAYGGFVVDRERGADMAWTSAPTSLNAAVRRDMVTRVEIDESRASPSSLAPGRSHLAAENALAQKLMLTTAATRAGELRGTQRTAVAPGDRIRPPVYACMRVLT